MIELCETKLSDEYELLWYNNHVHEKNRIIHMGHPCHQGRTIFCDMVEYLLYARDAFLFY